MSFILDALRKSEHARQHLGGATLAELPLGRRAPRLPWWVFALGALLMINLFALTFLLLRKEHSTETPALVAPSTAAAPLPMSTPAQSVAPAPIASLAEEAAPPSEVQYELIPRNESPLAATAPDGPTLVKKIDSVPSGSLPTTANGLPELHIDMHVYADAPRDRLVYINTRKYAEGETLAEGPRIAEITADGIRLSYHGEQLYLPRP